MAQVWGLSADICTMPKEPGPCMAFFRRWWYDKEKSTCSKFIYGGCKGNNNNFQSKAMCQNMCPSNRELSPQGIPSSLGPFWQACVWVLCSGTAIALASQVLTEPAPLGR